MKDEKYSDLYKILNKDQKKAVDTIEGPVMVIAGPGTGKTQVLTMRIANILEKTDIPPDGILALTFTDSGVKAMQERLLSIIGKDAYYVNIHTFHSFASDVMRSNPDEFIISDESEPLSELQSIFIFREILDSGDYKLLKPFNSKYFYLPTIKSKIKDLKREGITPEEYLSYINNEDVLDEKSIEKNIELQDIYKKYETRLVENKLYDFEDMINIVNEKFNESGELLQKYTERFQYFLIDEFQDTNNSQAQLIYKLAEYWGQEANLFVVGDDDQSIYRFQGASVENIINFNERYPKSEKITLKINYRSNQNILNASQSVIKNNKLRISNKIKIEKEQEAFNSNSAITLNSGIFNSSIVENYYIANKIQKLIKKGTDPKEIAVVYRNNSDSYEIADMLNRFNINYSLVRGENILQDGLIIRFLHLLLVVSKIKDASEDLDLFTLLNYEFLNLDSVDILKLSRFASNKKIHLFEAITHSEIENVNIENLKIIKNIYEKLIEWNEYQHNNTLLDTIEYIAHKSDFINWILKQENNYELLEIFNSFIKEIKKINLNPDMNIDSLLENIDLMKEYNIQINEKSLNSHKDSVRLTTAHGSKGLEFEYVFIPQFIDKKWSNKIQRDLLKLPSDIVTSVDYNDKSVQKEIQEEDDRRLFYVSLTRAKSEVFITSSEVYETQNNTKEAIPSMFMNEIDEEYFKTIDFKEYSNSNEILKNIFNDKYIDKKITSSEKEFLQNELIDFKLSATSLNTYLDCPYKFKLDFLFKTPRKKEKHLILGSGVHHALYKMNLKLKKQETHNIDIFIQDFNEFLENEVLNKDEYVEIKDEGELILKVYYETYGNDKDKSIIFYEKYFGSNWNKPILDENILLQGKIDKAILNSNTDKKSIKITDYKTGTPKTENQVLGKTKYSDKTYYNQLLFYYLLIDLDQNLNYEVSELELDFVGKRNSKPRKVQIIPNKKDIEEFKNLVRETHNNIMNLKFSRTKDYSKCDKCPYLSHCWPDGIPNENIQLSL